MLRPAIVCALSLSLFSLAHAAPQPPAIDRQVHLTEETQFLAPYVPAFQTSTDGRVGLSHKRETNRVAFRLQVPEKLNTPIIESPAGTFILSKPDAYADIEAGFPSTDVPGTHTAHLGLCDPSSAPGSNVVNPSSCGTGGADDCYNMTVIRADSDRRIWGIPVRVRVSQPKTVNATIAEVTHFTPIEGHLTGGREFFEPMVTDDGRLLTARMGMNGHFTWIDDNGEEQTSSSDLVYFMSSDEQAYDACDVRQWNAPRPMAQAPYDTRLNTRYGFAMQLFRDPRNQVLSSTQPMATYPWLDKDGDNLSFTMVNLDPFNGDYTTRCPLVLTTCAADADSFLGGEFQGRVIMGLWTRGKMILLDDILNNVDFGLRGFDGAHREIQLYEAMGGHDGWTRIGTARDNNSNFLPLGSPGISTFFDTNEHRFNYLPFMRPVTPGDVTWIMSTGRATTEVPFDDYLNANSFLNANMAQLVYFTETGGRGSSSTELQNAGTATRWNIPTHGDILGNGRIEPVAKGGVRGKGFWLDGNGSGIQFTVPAQPRAVNDSDWYISLFIDLRNLSGQRSLIDFPDGSAIQSSGSNQLLLIDSTGVTARNITLTPHIPLGSWMHLAVQMENQNRLVSTYINGNKIDEYLHTEALFELSEGELVLGAGTEHGANAAIGWVDDFKIFAEKVNPEVACNHALGTLVGVTEDAPTLWRNRADALPLVAHLDIGQLLEDHNKTTFDSYICYHDYSHDYAAHLSNIPTGLINVRDDINFPEGPIFKNRPRPDSSQNAFCLSCHTADGFAGLDIEALTLNETLLAPEDDRRQPMQPNPLVFGNIPAHWLGTGKPATAIDAGTDGVSIDEWVLPEASSAPTPQPSPSANPTPTPEPTASPIATPEPSPIPTPVTSPQPTPEPTPVPSGSGSNNQGNDVDASSGGGALPIGLFWTLMLLFVWNYFRAYKK